MKKKVLILSSVQQVKIFYMKKSNAFFFLSSLVLPLIFLIDQGVAIKVIANVVNTQNKLRRSFFNQFRLFELVFSESYL